MSSRRRCGQKFNGKEEEEHRFYLNLNLWYKALPTFFFLRQRNVPWRRCRRRRASVAFSNAQLSCFVRGEHRQTFKFCLHLST